jgi:hypothetical protein
VNYESWTRHQECSLSQNSNEHLENVSLKTAKFRQQRWNFDPSLASLITAYVPRTGIHSGFNRDQSGVNSGSSGKQNDSI